LLGKEASISTYPLLLIQPLHATNASSLKRKYLDLAFSLGYTTLRLKDSKAHCSLTPLTISAS
jgi:hypothetical protein